MNTVDLEPTWVRRAQWRLRSGSRAPIVVLGVGAVFACAFAVGRATDAGSRVAAEASSAPVAFAGASIPMQLGSAPLIGISLPSSAQPPQQAGQPAAALVAPVPAQPLAAQPLSSEVSPAPASSPARAPVRSAPPAPSVPAHQSQPSRGGSAGGGGATPPAQSGGGGTFESSG